MNINLNDNLIKVSVRAEVNDDILTGYVFMPMEMYEENEEVISSLSMRIDGTNINDVVKTIIVIKQIMLKELFKPNFAFEHNELLLDIIDNISEQTSIDYNFLESFNDFLIEEVSQTNPITITIDKNTFINNIKKEIPEGTKITYQFPMPKEISFEI